MIIKKTKSFNYSIVYRFCQCLLGLGLLVGGWFLLSGQASAVDTNNFKFSDFVVDYYLTKDEEGVSRMKVVEQLTAEFPDYDQNHGLLRTIPFTNQGGKNLTIADQKALNISVLRNGQAENIDKIEKEDGYYAVYIQDPNKYVHGRQVYQISYEFSKVVTDFADYQELFWDSNGTGWSQSFDAVTARLHLSKELKTKLDKKAWCYVGRSGEKGEWRCEITETKDGWLFRAEKLKAHENLSLVAKFAPQTFVVPEPEQHYGVVACLVGAGVLFVATIVFLWRQDRKYVAEKRRYYKGLFTPVQYTAPAKMTVAEAEQIYLGKGRKAAVATIMELAVQHKIELIKDEKKTWRGQGWRIKVRSLVGLTSAQRDVLEVLAGKQQLKAGQSFEVKRHSSSAQTVAAAKDFSSSTTRLLEKKALLNTQKTMKARVAATLSVIAQMGLLFLAVIVEGDSVGEVKGAGIYWPVLLTLILLSSLLMHWTLVNFRKYDVRTKKGLDMAKYLEGLRLYIKMAEAERLEFLQSVKGADSSVAGVVRLYEKLLPYACLFGLEKSWIAELNKYYETNTDLEPIWYSGTGYLMARDFNSFVSSANSSYTMASGSSSSSGSGGSGSSGGGGGGGGGGGI